MWIYVIVIFQTLLSFLTTLYFISLMRSRHDDKKAIEKESQKELRQIKALRENKLTVPLSEQTRPSTLDDIIGQEKGLKALRAALCSENPQHVIIYGPPGVGKTAAARVVLEEAKLLPYSPFKSTAKCIEIDATTLRYDDRGIADPLIGSVHDPIYQGAGAYGSCGVPQPKPGAVTRANGGILFIDEIGEMPNIQLNKLLKVLEDRKVMPESAYYSSFDKNIPPHIHDMFQNGLPADFRLIAATTRSPEEIPEAIKSRCVAVYFDSLNNENIIKIAMKASIKINYFISKDVAEKIACYAQNGRDCVNIVQSAAGIAMLENRSKISVSDIEYVAENGRYVPKIQMKVGNSERIGAVYGIGVYGTSFGRLINIETASSIGSGKVTVTGISDKEEVGYQNRRISGISSGRCSVSNVITVLKQIYNCNIDEIDLHINFPGGTLVDGPSAGTAVLVSVYSEIFKVPIREDVAITGEVSLKGEICPVGNVTQKIEAAVKAGIKTVYIPEQNWLEQYQHVQCKVVPVSHITELISAIIANKTNFSVTNPSDIIVADGI